MAMAWLVVMTKPRQEAKAAAHLVEQSFEVYLPQTPKRDPLGRVVGEEPLFPGYCFCGVVKGQSIAAFAPPRVSWPPFDLVNRLPI